MNKPRLQKKPWLFYNDIVKEEKFSKLNKMTIAV